MVIDTSALLAVIFGEPEAVVFAEILAASKMNLCCAVTALEARIVVEARKGHGAAKDFQVLLDAANITIVDFSADHSRLAVAAWRQYGKGNHKARLNMGDCCSYALAKAVRQPLLFKGEDFSRTDIAVVRY